MTGCVRDTSGALLRGSVVFLSPLARPADIRTTATGEDGRYVFGGLIPATYRVAALKYGYQTTVASVNTLLRSTLDIVLRPGDARDPGIARDMDWVLRLPPRDVLHDLDPAVEGALPGPSTEPGIETAFAASPASGSRLPSVPVDGEVQQWFSSGSPLAASDGPVADSSGSATSLRLALRLGDRLDLWLTGEHEREDAQIVGSDPSERLTGADRVGVCVEYDLGQLSRLDMQAAYRRDSLLLQGSDPSLIPSPDTESVTREWKTDWRRAIGQNGSLSVSALYVDEVSRGLEDDLLDIEPVVNRLWRAGWLYRTSLGTSHVLSLGLRARMLDLGGSEARSYSPAGYDNPISLAGPTPPGWAVHLHGAEEWSLTRAVDLDFGLDYHRSLSVREVAHLVPQAGAVFHPNPRTVVKAAVSYVADSYAEATPSRTALPAIPPGPAQPRARNPIGYQFVVERQSGEETVIALSAASRPIAYEYEGDRPILPVVDERPIYVSDGEAESSEAGIELRHRFRGMTARIGSTWGRIEGLYAASLPGEPLQEMHEGKLRYLVTSVSGRLRDSGTEGRVELRSLRERADDLGDPVEFRLSSLSFFISQDLDFIQLGEARWRLMLAYQDTLGSPSPTEWSEDGYSRELRHLLNAGNRVSGGVSVQF